MENLKQPTSVRWKIEKMDLIRQTECLNSAQEVFTFLLDKYWWENKIASIKDKTESPAEKYIDDSNAVILEKISEIKKESIPKDRNTSLGRRIWQEEQNVKIKELEMQLK